MWENIDQTDEFLKLGLDNLWQLKTQRVVVALQRNDKACPTVEALCLPK
jgi:hypothetical protein